VVSGRQTAGRTYAPVAASCLIVAFACAGSCRPAHDPSSPYPSVIAVDTGGVPAGWLALPSRPDSVKFAVIGDSGRGWAPQHEVARQMVAYRQRFPFSFVLMAGDNIYQGPATADDYRTKFEEPYQALLADGVKFYAVLGNHDDPRQRDYAPFNMRGHRYYTFTPPANVLARLVTDVRVFALDSTDVDTAEQAWLAEQLAKSRARWKIVLLHHPLYTSGRYGLQARLLRWRLESMLVEHGTAVVFSGHEHIYQRSHLQRGVQYFITGGAGSLRRGDGYESPVIARSYDRDFHFMLVEIADNALYFQAITRTGATIDAGVLRLE